MTVDDDLLTVSVRELVSDRRLAPPTDAAWVDDHARDSTTVTRPNEADTVPLPAPGPTNGAADREPLP